MLPTQANRNVTNPGNPQYYSLAIREFTNLTNCSMSSPARGRPERDAILADTANPAVETLDPGLIADWTARCAAFADN